MGLRSAAYICQRVTNAVRFILVNHFGQEVINYLDDFAGCEDVHNACLAYDRLGWVLKECGLEESVEKASPPSTKMVFLGVLFNTEDLTLSITPERLNEISGLVKFWLEKDKCTLKELQSLLGKLHFVSNCVKPGRIFVSRLLVWLRKFPSGFSGLMKKIPRYVMRDLFWWDKFLGVYNGVSMISLEEWSDPDIVLSSDSSLVGCGGVSGSQYFHAAFPSFIVKKSLHINALELLIIVVCLKLWSISFKGKKIRVFCDNMSSVTVLNTGACRNVFMQSCLREICFLSATYQFEIRGQHLSSEDNRLADWLSRWSLDEFYQDLFLQEAVQNKWKEVNVPESYFQFIAPW